jgi:hypothetical protein
MNATLNANYSKVFKAGDKVRVFGIETERGTALITNGRRDERVSLTDLEFCNE